MKLRRQHFILYPELSLFPSDEERLAAVKTLDNEIRRTLWRRPLIWLVAIAYSVVNVLAVFLSIGLSHRSAASPPVRIILACLPTMTLGIGFAFGMQYVWRAPMQKALRRLLVSKGIPVCIKCGYSLTGNKSGVCPECGTTGNPGLTHRRYLE